MKRKAKRIVPDRNNPSRNSNKIACCYDDGLGTTVPPSFNNIEIYFEQKELLEVACNFYNEHELREWRNATGQPILNWKVCAAEWIYNYRQEIKRRFRKSPFYSESS